MTQPAAGGLPEGPPVRTRIGLIAPFDLALDDELARWVPEGISLHTARTPRLPGPVDLHLVERLNDHDQILACIGELSAIEPAAYAYACTAASFVDGVTGEHALAEAIRLAAGVPAVTTSGALLAALTALEVRSVAVAAPYDIMITERLVRFLAEAAITVTGYGSLGLTARIWEVPYRTTAELIRRLPGSGAEAVLLACTNLSSYDLIAPLEAELGMPVVSANQATVWAALRLVGRRAVGPGQALVERT